MRLTLNKWTGRLWSCCFVPVMCKWPETWIHHLCIVHAKLLQSCLTLCDPIDCSRPGSSVHGILQARMGWEMGCHFLLQGIFLTQGSNLLLWHLLHRQADSLPLAPPGKGLYGNFQIFGWPTLPKLSLSSSAYKTKASLTDEWRRKHDLELVKAILFLTIGEVFHC